MSKDLKCSCHAMHKREHLSKSMRMAAEWWEWSARQPISPKSHQTLIDHVILPSNQFSQSCRLIIKCSCRKGCRILGWWLLHIIRCVPWLELLWLLTWFFSHNYLGCPWCIAYTQRYACKKKCTWTGGVANPHLHCTPSFEWGSSSACYRVWSLYCLDKS